MYIYYNLLNVVLTPMINLLWDFIEKEKKYVKEMSPLQP